MQGNIRNTGRCWRSSGFDGSTILNLIVETGLDIDDNVGSYILELKSYNLEWSNNIVKTRCSSFWTRFEYQLAFLTTRSAAILSSYDRPGRYH